VQSALRRKTRCQCDDCALITVPECSVVVQLRNSHRF
jgi:hypothetical protein